MNFESAGIRDQEFENHLILRESDSRDHQSDLLSRFLDIAPDKAREVVETEYLFAD